MVAVDVRNDRSGTEAFYNEYGFEIPNVFDTRNVAVSQYGVAAPIASGAGFDPGIQVLTD